MDERNEQETVEGQPPPEGEMRQELTSGVILRRFDPTDESRCTIDEAGGPPRLKAYAFQWAPTVRDENNVECSVYVDAVLLASGLTRADCLEERNAHWAVAEASIADVTSFTRANKDDANPFSVLMDPFPDGKEGGHARDVAHANVHHSLPLPGKDAWRRDLALRFKTAS
jgi:hypothetical protein